MSKSVHKFSTFTTVCEKFLIAREKVVVTVTYKVAPMVVFALRISVLKLL